MIYTPIIVEGKLRHTVRVKYRNIQLDQTYLSQLCAVLSASDAINRSGTALGGLGAGNDEK